MWVEKLPSGKYRYCERFKDPVTGESKRVSVVMEKNNKQTQKLAYEILRSKIYTADPSSITFGELVDMYLEAQKPLVKASTWERNKVSLGTIKMILGENTRVEKMTAGWIRQRFLATGRSNSTINEFLTRFKAAIRWAYKNDVIDDIRFIDKLDNLKDTPHAAKIQDKYLEADELAALLASMHHQVWLDLTSFLALSGLRIGEALALKRSDLDMINREINVDKTYDTIHGIVTSPKTYASQRRVYMQDELYALCQELLDAKILSFSDILFNNFGEYVSYNSYRAYLRRHAEKAIGRPITPHVLRHTHASLLMEQGMDMDAIAARLGHDDSNITRQIYVHVTKRLEEKWNNQMKEISLLSARQS